MFFINMDEQTLSYIVFVIAIYPWLNHAMVFLMMVISNIYSRVKLYKPTKPTMILNELPGVSIVKPLMGTDPFLESNLESHFLLNYPKFELLMCVQDENDPVINVINHLREKHPKVDCRLFIGGKDGVLNPMVHNMAPGYENAKYDLIWISTSRIKANTEIILDLVGKMQLPKVGIVHQMPFTTDQGGLAAAVEKIYFGATITKFYLAFNSFGIPCMTGMSYMFRKSDVDELKGLAHFGRYLAEDFFLSKQMHEKGHIVKVSAFPALQNVASPSIAGYKDRMVRWHRLRLNMMPFVSAVFEPLSESIILGIYMSWSIHHFFEVNPYLYFLCHMALWCIMDYIQLKGTQHGPISFNKLTFLVAWIIREVLFVFTYFEAISSPRTITWGKRTYHLSNFGEHMEILSDKAILPI